MFIHFSVELNDRPCNYLFGLPHDYRCFGSQNGSQGGSFFRREEIDSVTLSLEQRAFQFNAIDVSSRTTAFAGKPGATDASAEAEVSAAFICCARTITPRMAQADTAANRTIKTDHLRVADQREAFDSAYLHSRHGPNAANSLQEQVWSLYSGIGSSGI